MKKYILFFFILSTVYGCTISDNNETRLKPSVDIEVMVKDVGDTILIQHQNKRLKILSTYKLIRFNDGYYVILHDRKIPMLSNKNMEFSIMDKGKEYQIRIKGLGYTGNRYTQVVVKEGNKMDFLYEYVYDKKFNLLKIEICDTLFYRNN